MLRTWWRHARPLRRILPFVLTLLGITLAASAQQTSGAIVGTIIDPLGGRVAGAAVTLLRDGQLALHTTSDGQGEFMFDALSEGRYRIEARAEGLHVRTT